MEKASAPDTRITAIPPCPGGVEIAQIVSDEWCFNLLYLKKNNHYNSSIFLFFCLK